MSVASPLGLLGAPGIRIVAPDPLRALAGVRRDTTAFLGVAPRGPARLPVVPLAADDDVATWLVTAPRRRSRVVEVTGWDEYRRLFGGYEGPGRLPYAVAAFFAGGGRRARIVRIVHDYGDATDDAACSTGVLAGLRTDGGAALRLRARDEGSWGDRLRATLRFDTRPLALVGASTVSELLVDRREWVPRGSLLRLDLGGPGSEFAYVDDSRERSRPVGATLDRALTLATAASSAPVAASVVTARLEVVDTDPAVPRREELVDLGLRADHPRWLARAITVESALVWPDAQWSGGALDTTDLTLTPVPLVALADPPGPVPYPDDSLARKPGRPPVVEHMKDGRDRWQDVTTEDFFDPDRVVGDEAPGNGIEALAGDVDVGLVVTPDLYDPLPLAPADEVADPPTLCGPEFQTLVGELPVVAPPPAAPELDGLRLDPLVPADYAVIEDAQRRLVEWAERRRDITVLLDVPPGLAQRQILAWRNGFDSAFAAAYHPWHDVAAPDDQRTGLVRMNPAAFAAPIIAARELRLGVQHGPAGELAPGAVRVADVVLPPQHDQLHVAGIDVFVADRDGIRLTGARTLSRRPELRQLSVARLMTVLRLTLEREMTWAVFEPNNADLWGEVRRLIHDLLSRFYDAGAFRGATTNEAFFVRCDRTTMTQHDIDNGRMVCLVGVAPVEPVEYILIEVALTSDGVRVDAG